MVIDISYWMHPPLTEPYTYGLFFLLGSFTVAALSDVRRLSAQSEFLEVWLAVVAVLLLWDIYQLRVEPADRFALKWGATIVLCVFSHERVGVLFKLAKGDVSAMAAVCGLLSPLLVFVFFIILKVVDVVMKPAMRSYGNDGAYPFMPVVTVSAFVTFPVAAFLQSLRLVF